MLWCSALQLSSGHVSFWLACTSVVDVNSVSFAANSLPPVQASHPTGQCWSVQVVEQELTRVPRHLSSLVAKQLWSIIYMPQVSCNTLMLFC